MSQMNRLDLGKARMMMINRVGLWCVMFVWFHQFLLKSLCGQGGGVYFVPHHLPSDAQWALRTTRPLMEPRILQYHAWLFLVNTSLVVICFPFILLYH